MPQNPPANMPRVTPYLYYRDAARALDFLTKAFGLKERMRVPGPDGHVMHGELEIEDGVVMLGRPGGEYRGPGGGGVHSSVYIYVDDVDAHCARARAAGAKIYKEPADEFYGDRVYGAEDSEGHHWYFATHIRDVAPEDLKPPA